MTITLQNQQSINNHWKRYWRIQRIKSTYLLWITEQSRWSKEVARGTFLTTTRIIKEPKDLLIIDLKGNLMKELVKQQAIIISQIRAIRNITRQEEVWMDNNMLLEVGIVQ